MATVYGLNATLAQAGGIATIGRGLIDARVKVMVDSYALTTGNTAGDVIQLGAKLPTGANILGIMLSATVAQTSLTFTLGDLSSATRYIASAHSGLQTAITPVWVDGKGYVAGTTDTSATVTDRQIILTTAGATATAATLYVKIFYSQD